jgi:hypothetical protein
MENIFYICGVNLKRLFMKTNFLLPHGFRKWGWSILGIAFILIFYSVYFESELSFFDWKVFAVYSNHLLSEVQYFTWISNNVQDEISALLVIIGGLFVAFSKQKIEDEMVAKIRTESLVWATYVNYIVLAFCLIFFYGMSFLTLLLCNMFTILGFFIFRFQWKMFQSNKLTEYD